MIRWSRHVARAGVAAVLLLAPAPVLPAQREGLDLTVEAPASLAPLAERVRQLDRQELALALARAGLAVPPQIHITLIPPDDPRTRVVPRWIVGLASGAHAIAIFPDRIGSTAASSPYDSLESVVWHEVVHLALTAQAGDALLPRWFHEGVAMSVEKGWGVTSQVELLLVAGGHSGLADLGRLFESDAQPETSSAYLLAAALVSDLRQRHGAATPGAIVDRVARGMPFAEAYERETGETPDEAAAHAWQAYRRWSSWIPTLTSGSSVWVLIMAVAFMAFLARLRTRRRRRREWDQEEQAAWRAAQALPPPPSPSPLPPADDGGLTTENTHYTVH